MREELNVLQQKFLSCDKWDTFCLFSAEMCKSSMFQLPQGADQDIIWWGKQNVYPVRRANINQGQAR